MPPRSGPDQKTEDNVGVQAVQPCRPDQGNGLPECERLRRTAFLADGYVHERGDTAAHFTATGMAPTVSLMETHIASDLVGDTGIEPVTSSV